MKNSSDDDRNINLIASEEQFNRNIEGSNPEDSISEPKI